MKPYPKPPKADKPAPSRPQRKTRVKRSKIKAPRKYMRPEYRALREERLEECGRRCQLKHAKVCTKVATQVHHPYYMKGRGWKSLMIPKADLIPCCAECHEVEDPWLNKGMGLGSRERNARKERTGK